ncbi:MAG: pilus assembly protein TadG [Phycisphaerales bacterium]|nr:pilus assembly protein TadG [Hyphomonadaceae bacterium]
MMWALMGTVLLGLIGLTVDFTRAQALRAQMQNAVDGAALAAARGDTLTDEQRHAAARAFFDAEMGDYAAEATLTLTDVGDNDVQARGSMPMPLGLAQIVRNEDWTLSVSSEAERSGNNIEVAMVLDVTGSMSGSRITSLRTAATNLVNTVVRDEQTPYYSKVALVPYSMGVNAGAYADEARGAIAAAESVTNAAWHDGISRSISGITRANPGVVTSNNHGFANGQTIYISGVNGMTQVNNRVFTISSVNTNTFRLTGVNSSGYNAYTSGGTIRRCLNATCSVVVTSNGHDFAAADRVYFTSVGGMTQLNNNVFTISAVTSNTFTLQGSGGGYSAYTSGGNAFCVVNGCEYFAFNNAASNALRVFRVSTCVSERLGPQASSDAAPGGARVGYNYPSSANVCPTTGVTPLTTDRNLLNTRISAFQAAGSTAGHIGLAWGWYMISPNWASLFPAASRGVAYNTPETLKIVVLMTDGAFNTGYCNGVISRDSNNGAGAASERINCDATNGAPFAQAAELCDEMKDEGVIIYTVGFELNGDNAAEDFMEECATSSDHAYLTGGGAELIAAFDAIAASISQLRITR